jgi:hypothetical protein
VQIYKEFLEAQTFYQENRYFLNYFKRLNPYQTKK